MTDAPDLLVPTVPADLPRTVGALRASGHAFRTVKQELRDNLLARLRDGGPRFPGIVGYDDTVLPEVERALLAGHDMVLLGERGQGKTRLIRALVSLLDEWTPMIEGSELREHPYHPLTPASRRLAAETGEALPVAWLHRSQRYGEKLATPDTSVGDLIGDVDPIKVAQGRALGDPDTIHFGLVPRTNRGIFAVNELPDLAERIQVSLLNVLEERDIQVRGYQLRLPLDLLLVASANPEDYTNRGRIITPLKDRFGAEIRTHYPLDLSLETALVRQEAALVAAVPDHLVEVLVRYTRAVRESPAVDARSGVSARFAIAAAETVAASALRRAGLRGERDAVARVCDTVSVTSTLRGKVEFDSGEEGRETEILAHLLRTATAETFRARLAGLDLSAFTALVSDGGSVSTGDLVAAEDLLRQVGPVPGLAKVLDRLGLGDAPNAGEAAAGVEFVLEGLHLTRRLSKDMTGTGSTVYGAETMPGRFRYGEWRDGPDPLAPPYDVRAAVDEVGERVLDGENLRDALRELLRRGPRDGAGLEDLAARVRRMRRDALRRGNLDGAVTRAQALLDQALAAEREELGGRADDAARFAEAVLDNLPGSTAHAVRELSSYEWVSDEARAAYRQILQGLRRDVVQQRFAGMRDALAARDPASDARIADMVGDLNDLLGRHARGEDTDDAFAEFMRRHGEFFPEQPANVDELVDQLARRAAAAERLMRSLSPAQREELRALMAEAFGEGPLAGRLAELTDNLRALRPDLNWQRGERIRGADELGYGDATATLGDLADLDDLLEQLGQEHPGATLDDIDVEAVQRQLGRGAADDVSRLRELERELRRQGWVTRDDEGLTLSPKALRRLGGTALSRVFADLSGRRRGEHDLRDAGAAGELTGGSRAWHFGDEQPLDTVRTIGNAVRRRAARGTPGAGAGVRLEVEDFEVAETERRASAVVALCVDLSFSMISEGRWGPMKQTALALSHLVATRFPQDALQIIGFGRYAMPLTQGELAAIEPDMVQGTNLQHALKLAGRHVRRHPGAEPVVLVVTDGEPTAHLEDGEAYFRWPTLPETVRATLVEVDQLTRYGAMLNLFMLGEDPGLRRFVDAVARRSGGRVFSPEAADLGAYVVSDYVRARRGRS